MSNKPEPTIIDTIQAARAIHERITRWHNAYQEARARIIAEWEAQSWDYRNSQGFVMQVEKAARESCGFSYPDSELLEWGPAFAKLVASGYAPPEEPAPEPETFLPCHRCTRLTSPAIAL